MTPTDPDPAETSEELPAPPGWAAKTVYVVAGIGIVSLLLLHTVKWHRIQVDYTSVLLLALLVLLPLAHYVRRLKVGGIEAEIDRRSVRRLRDEAADLPAAAPAAVDDAGGVDTLELVAMDPALGLAKLRIDLEQELRRRYEEVVPPDDPIRRHGRPGNASIYLRALERHRAIPLEVVRPLREVLALANRAIHGEHVRPQDAQEIADVGVRVLDALRTASTTDGEARDGD